MKVRFEWDDGVQNKYQQTYLYLPRVVAPTEARQTALETLDGGAFLVYQTDDGGVPIIPRSVIVTWDPDSGAPADPAFLAIAQATHEAMRAVTMTFPWRDGTDTITGRIVARHEHSARGQMHWLEITVQEIAA